MSPFSSPLFFISAPTTFSFSSTSLASPPYSTLSLFALLYSKICTSLVICFTFRVIRPSIPSGVPISNSHIRQPRRSTSRIRDPRGSLPSGTDRWSIKERTSLEYREVIGLKCCFDGFGDIYVDGRIDVTFGDSGRLIPDR